MAKYIAEPYIPDKDKIKSPLRYPGGKFYALKHIMPYIVCVDHDEYREPFLGGGSVFFAKRKASINILNDLEQELGNLYNTIQNDQDRKRLIDMLSMEIASKERHEQIKAFVPQNNVEKAYRTYYLNRTSYCGIINAPSWGYVEGKSSPPKNWGKFLNDAAEKLSGICVSSKDFSEILDMPKTGERVLMYLDPPYYHADQKRAYTQPFEVHDHIRLAEQLKTTPFMFCLSYDDCKEIRELYKWANIYDVSWLYNTDNKPGMHRKLCRELIITNYTVEHK